MRHGLLRALDAAEHDRIDEAADIEEGVVEAGEADQRADAVVAVAGEDRYVAGARLLQCPVGHRLQLERKAQSGARQDAALAVEHQCLVQRAQLGLRRDDLIEARGIDAEEAGVAVEIARHAGDVGADRLLVLVQIGFGDGKRFRKRRAHPLAEPRLHAEGEQQVRKDRDDDRRNDREQAEHQDEAHMQLRAGKAAPPLSPDLHQPPRDDREERQDENEVQQEVERVEMRARIERRQALQCRPGRCRRQRRRHGERERELPAETDSACPDNELAPDAHRIICEIDSPCARDYFMPRPTSMSNSRIFLRSVLRLRPRSWAARSWLPRVAPSVSWMSGRSISRSTRP